MISLETDPNPFASLSYALNEAMEGNDDNRDNHEDDHHHDYDHGHDDDDDEALPSLNLDECNAISDYARNNNTRQNHPRQSSSQPQQQQSITPGHIPPPMAYSSFPQSDASSLNLDDGSTPRSSEVDDDDDVDNNNNNNNGKRTRKKKKKSSLGVRWLVLVLNCAVMTGSYYAYDIPAALHQQLADYMPPSSNYETHFNLLYTVYSVPNVILPLFGGTFVDRHGAPLCLALFSFTVCLGAALLSVGVTNQSWEVMYLGRFVFGMGAESLCVAQSTIVSDWFEGKEVALAMGIGLAVSRLGSIWNNIISPKVANNAGGGGIQSAFWIGAVVTCCSVAAAGCTVLVDKRAVRKLERRNGGEALHSLTEALLENQGGESEMREGGDGLEGDAGRDNRQDDAVLAEGETAVKSACVVQVESGVNITDVRKFTLLFWLLTLSCFVVYGCVLPFNNVASGILLERNYFTSSPSDCGLEYPDQCSVGYLQQGTNDALDANGDVCSIAPSQAPVLPTSVSHTSADSDMSDEWEEGTYVYPSLTSDHVDCGDPFWTDACTSNYCTKQNAATEHAGKVMSIPYLISAVSSPPLGHLVDRFGRRAQIAVFSSSLLLVVHLTLAISASSPIGPMIGQGIAYSLYAAVLWPSVPLTVPKEYTGTAFGVITSIQNIGLALFPLAIAAIYNVSGRRYIPHVEFFFMACAAAGVMVGLVMNRLDGRCGNKLNKVYIEEEEVEVAANDVGEEGDGDFAAVEGDQYFSPLLQSEGVIS